MKDEGGSVEDMDDTDQYDRDGNDLEGMGLVIWSENCRKLMR